MRAAVLGNIGDETLELRDDVTVVAPGPREVRVKVHVSGICHSDLSAMDGTLPALAPGVVGHEGAGEVVEVGSAVGELEVGDHVTVSFVPPCGRCPSCLRGEFNLCSVHAIAAFTSPRFRLGDQPVFGYAGLGTFADELVVPVEGAVKVDSDVPYEQAALIACGVLTGVGSVLNTAKVPEGASVAVIGCGGVGVSVLQGARLAGASAIVGVDPVEGKHSMAKHFGATHTVTPDQVEDAKQELTSAEGFDYVFDVVGASATIRSAWDLARRGGTVVVVGAGKADAMVSFSAQELFLHDKKILGSFYGSCNVHADTPKMVRLWRAGKLDLESLVSKRLGFEQINEGLGLLREGGTDVIRQIVTVNP
ncbi:Zn-dependent alcohol dehydrogenase [Sciscionella sediminilitoris]|uniref:Zn-dependent alcohol dehydrogenase n=1 Tax=Sciscionella sediminilitoris TaxID=1445613 RepID=UPI0004DECF59|nr:Zn-dependent alcohol dehydrogenase [Sciscionella sp. SE31]